MTCRSPNVERYPSFLCQRSSGCPRPYPHSIDEGADLAPAVKKCQVKNAQQNYAVVRVRSRRFQSASNLVRREPTSENLFRTPLLEVSPSVGAARRIGFLVVAKTATPVSWFCSWDGPFIRAFILTAFHPRQYGMTGSQSRWRRGALKHPTTESPVLRVSIDGTIVHGWRLLCALSTFILVERYATTHDQPAASSHLSSTPSRNSYGRASSDGADSPY
jgi:hypothetical protein